MESIPDEFSYYAIFCIATAICMLRLNVKAFREVGYGWDFRGGLIYYGISTPCFLVGAPIFFLIYIFRSAKYYNNLKGYITEIYLDSDDKS